MDHLLLDSLGQGIDAITDQDIEREPLVVLDACLDVLSKGAQPDKDREKIKSVIQMAIRLKDLSNIKAAYSAVYDTTVGLTPELIEKIQIQMLYDESVPKTKSNAKGLLKGLPRQTFQPPITVKPIKKTVDSLDSQYEAAFKVAAKEDVRAYIQGVYTSNSGQIVATDGHRVLIVEAGSNKHLGKILAPKKAKSNNSFKVIDGYYDAKFPAYERLLPTRAPVTSHTISANELAAITGALDKAYSLGAKDSAAVFKVDQALIAFNPAYLKDAGEIMGAFGYSEFTLYTYEPQDAVEKSKFINGVVKTVSPDNKVTYLIASMRMGNEENQYINKLIDFNDLSGWIKESQSNKKDAVNAKTESTLFYDLERNFIGDGKDGNEAYTGILVKDDGTTYATTGKLFAVISSQSAFDKPGLHPSKYTSAGSISRSTGLVSGYPYPDVDGLYKRFIQQSVADTTVSIVSFLRQMKAKMSGKVAGRTLVHLKIREHEAYIFVDDVRKAFELMSSLNHQKMTIRITSNALLIQSSDGMDLAGFGQVRYSPDSEFDVIEMDCSDQAAFDGLFDDWLDSSN